MTALTFRAPMLADDADLEKLVFPAIWQPKIDGVRAYHPGQFLARSMEPHANRFTANFFNNPMLQGFDGELAAEHHQNPRLCSLTTSATNTHAGEPFVLWWLFDDFSNPDVGYLQRFHDMCKRVEVIKQFDPALGQRLRIVECRIVKNLDEFLALHAAGVEAGYEGSIYRRIDGLHKDGRSTNREGGLLRVKPFTEDECRITRLEEGRTNGNEQTTGANGKAKRSTHAENMVPNGMLGAYYGVTIKDIVVNNGKKIIPKGTEVKVSAGKMDHGQRKYAMEHPEEFIGTIGKFQHFPKGVKDKIRFPTHQSFRAATDL